MGKSYLSEKYLVITESPKLAVHIAAALGGIHDTTNDSIIQYDEIESKKEQINKLAESFFFHTRLNGNNVAVTWLSSNYLKKRRPLPAPKTLDGLPVLTKDEDYIIEEKSFYRLLQGKYCKTVYFAFSPSSDAHIAKDVIRKKIIKSASFYDIRINNISKKYLQNAFNDPVTNVGLNGAVNSAQNRKVLTGCLEKNLSAVVNHFCGLNAPINHHILTALLLLNQREERLGQNRYAIRASINVNGTWCVATSKLTFSESDAKKLINETLPTEIISKGFADANLPTTASLFKVYAETENINLRSATKNLYEKGYISQPLTTNTHLLARFTDSEIDMLTSLCSEYSTADNPILALGESHDILKRMKNAHHTAENLSAIIPYPGKLPLSDEEKLVYKVIAQSIIKAINHNENRRYEFLAGNISLYAKVPSSQLKESLRPKRKWPVTYDIADAEYYTRYSPYELIEDLEKRNIGGPDIYLTLIDTLLKYDLVVLKDNTLSLSEMGKQICSLFAFDPEIITLCGKWETGLFTIEKGASSSFVSILDDVHKRITAWVETLLTKETALNVSSHDTKAMRANIGDTKASAAKPIANEAKVTATPQIKSDALVCPACGNSSLALADRCFKCRECGKTYENNYVHEDAIFMLRTVDIKALVSRGKTTLKFTKRKTGDLLAGFIYLNNNKDMAFTNKSENKCPYCNSDMHVYDWGFACEKCDFNVPFEIHGIKLDSENLQKLLRGETTNLIEGLTFSNGTKVSAKLQIDTNGTLKYYRN